MFKHTIGSIFAEEIETKENVQVKDHIINR